ncbi:hypothetical protein ACFLXC_02085 [Chloroflexota bacterium]
MNDAYYHINVDWETDPDLGIVPENAVFYPYILLKFMEPAFWQIAVAVDLTEGKVVLAHQYPTNKGPSVPALPAPVVPASVEIRLAPIHDVQVNIAKSNPPQVMVHIQGGLSDGCTSFHALTVERDGNKVNITVTTQRPVDAICTQVYGFLSKM